MHLVHLTSSTHFGGPERQMLGLAQHLSEPFQTTFLSFSEGNRCREFLTVAHTEGFEARELTSDTPRLGAALSEVIHLLRTLQADMLITHGYKANLLGRIAARRLRIPIVGVSRGWTGEDWKVRVYEFLDRTHLRFLDHIVAVSEGQASKVRRAGVPASKISVIRNASRLDAFDSVDASACRDRLRAWFPKEFPRTHIVMAAGRLSPEKGFSVLVESATRVIQTQPLTGFILFGEGPERNNLESQIRTQGLKDRFILAGFSNRLDELLPGADLLAVPSFTEGLPNVLLEAGAAGIAAIASNVGGIPEVIEDGTTGQLVNAGDPDTLANALIHLLSNAELRSRYGAAAREKMDSEFTFDAQARAYEELFTQLNENSPSLVH